jgi:hypothetical protein
MQNPATSRDGAIQITTTDTRATGPAQLSPAVVVPTNRDSYASRDEQGKLLRARGQRFVRSLLASGGCPLRDASPRATGSTLERSEEFAEAPREERE